jgi:hypothetical protein
MISQDGPHDLCLNAFADNIWASGYHQAEQSAEDILDMIGDARVTVCANQSPICIRSCSAFLFAQACHSACDPSQGQGVQSQCRSGSPRRKTGWVDDECCVDVTRRPGGGVRRQPGGLLPHAQHRRRHRQRHGQLPAGAAGGPLPQEAAADIQVKTQGLKARL